MNGARAVLEALEREGVDIIFGYPGGAIMPLYDALFQHPVRHALCRHEAAAAFAASGYARTSGRVGVCCATSGPGATNLVTALLDAMMDSVPVVAITGQVRSELMGTDGFQEADVCAITQTVTKRNFLISDAREIARVMAEAFALARSGRPGPVLVDIPSDVLKVDKAFVDEVGHTVKGSALAEAIVRLGRSLDLATVAEGIEDVQQIEGLRDLGCVYGQGFYFARPATSENIDRLLASGGVAMDGAMAAPVEGGSAA